MTYRAYEDSATNGRPVELYHFYDDLSNHWYVCSGGQSVNFLGHTYENQPIASGPLIIGGDIETENITIYLWRGANVATQYIDTPVDGRLDVEVYRQHADQYVRYWSGVVVNVKFDDDAVPSFIVEPGVTASGRTGHRRRNQRSCDHALYSVGYGCCNVVKALFTRTGVVLTINGLTVTAAVFATEVDGWFKGGVLTIGYAERLIMSHVGTAITVNRSMAIAAAGNTLTATAGCNHLPTICTTKFNNKLNFGGNEFLTQTNVYAGHHVLY